MSGSDCTHSSHAHLVASLVPVAGALTPEACPFFMNIITDHDDEAGAA